MELFISDLVKYKRMGELEELGQFLTKDTRIDIKVMCIFFSFVLRLKIYYLSVKCDKIFLDSCSAACAGYDGQQGGTQNAKEFFPFENLKEIFQLYISCKIIWWGGGG